MLSVANALRIAVAWWPQSQNSIYSALLHFPELMRRLENFFVYFVVAPHVLLNLMHAIEEEKPVRRRQMMSSAFIDHVDDPSGRL